MSGCKTCGSVGVSAPSRDEYPESMKCHCGFRNNRDMWSLLYSISPSKRWNGYRCILSKMWKTCCFF